MSFKSVHLSGAGNNFHIVYENDIQPSAELVRKMCGQFLADGVVFLKQKAPGYYSWDFYNNDGSLAEMCGNATRCVGFFVKNVLKDPSPSIQLETQAGIVEIKTLKEDRFEVRMPKAVVLPHSQYFYCNTGVPHVVIEVDQQKDFSEYKDQCRQIRQSSDFAPKGTNVTLVKRSVHTDSRVATVSFERGVEDFTSACGTGAVAAALFVSEKYGVKKMTLETYGGMLTVDVSNLNFPIMVGPVNYLKDCLYDIKI